MTVNTILLVLLVIVNYTNFQLTHIHGRKPKRFSPWLRKEKVTDLEIIKQYYGYSNENASNALKILTTEQINFIKQRLETGGSK